MPPWVRVAGVTTAYKVVVDPQPTPTGGVIIYAALGGLNGGLWRSEDTGQTWQKLSDDTVEGTIATDVVLDLDSATVNGVRSHHHGSGDGAADYPEQLLDRRYGGGQPERHGHVS